MNYLSNNTGLPSLRYAKIREIYQKTRKLIKFLFDPCKYFFYLDRNNYLY